MSNCFGKIAIVDDEPGVREVVSHIVQALNYDFETFEDGELAFEAFQKNKVEFDVVITDILMPKLDGYSLVKKMRENDRMRSIPVIIYSAIYDPERSPADLEKFGELHDFDNLTDILNENTYFISKPFTIRQIKDLLEIFKSKAFNGKA